MRATHSGCFLTDGACGFCQGVLRGAPQTRERDAPATSCQTVLNRCVSETCWSFHFLATRALPHRWVHYLFAFSGSTPSRSCLECTQRVQQAQGPPSPKSRFRSRTRSVPPRARRRHVGPGGPRGSREYVGDSFLAYQFSSQRVSAGESGLTSGVLRVRPRSSRFGS